MKLQQMHNNQKKNTSYSFYNLKIIAIVFIILILYLLIGKLTGYYLPCAFHKVTAFYCPGCGITRLFLKLLEFDFLGAFNSNQLVFCLIPLFLFYLLLEFRYSITGKKNFMNHRKFSIIWVLLGIITILFGILRNIDKFSYLAP